MTAGPVIAGASDFSAPGNRNAMKNTGIALRAKNEQVIAQKAIQG
jgi:hypothetical protein